MQHHPLQGSGVQRKGRERAEKRGGWARKASKRARELKEETGQGGRARTEKAGKDGTREDTWGGGTETF